MLLVGMSNGLAAKFGAEFWPFFQWTVIWTGVLLLLLSASGAVGFIRRLTPFSSEVFEFFVLSSFMYESARDLVLPLNLGAAGRQLGRGVAYADVLLAVTTFAICNTLLFAERSTLFGPTCRRVLAQYAQLIGLVVGTALSYIPGVDQGDPYGGIPRSDGIRRLPVRAPWDWQPMGASQPNATRTSWFYSPIDGAGGAGGILGALYPAVCLTALFYFDHNISAMLAHAAHYPLRKPTAYHWDNLVLGGTTLLCALFGVPPGNGLIPQAPWHTRALATAVADEVGGVRLERFTHVEEQRYSALAQALLMFVALCCFGALQTIPLSVLNGIYFFMGASGMYGCDVYKRLWLLVTEPARLPHIPVVTAFANKGHRWKLPTYLAIQVGCAAVFFYVGVFGGGSVSADGQQPNGYFTWSITFPLLFPVFHGVRLLLLPCLFSDDDLAILDAQATSHDDKQRESKAVADSHRDSSSTCAFQEPSLYSRAAASSLRRRARPHDCSARSSSRSRYSEPTLSSVSSATPSRAVNS